MATINTHLSPKRGRVKCEATQRACRYGQDDHQTYEIPPHLTEKEFLNQINSGQVEFVPEQKEEEQPYEPKTDWVISAQNLDTFKNRIESLNRRLEKAGVEDKFEYTVEETYIDDEETGLKYLAYKVDLNTPTLKHNGWKFVARVDELSGEGDEENSYIVSSIGDEDNVQSNFPITSQKCDHCGQVRHRTKTYVLKSDDGEYKQIGSNCMRPFLGVTPSFWALDPGYVREKVDKDLGGAGGRFGAMAPPVEVIALGLALSDRGEHYAGSGGAGLSTKEKVMDYLFNSRSRKIYGHINKEEYMDQAKQIMDELKLEGDSDYAVNTRTLLKQKYVGTRHWGYVVSAIAAHRRQNAVAKVKAERVYKKGHFGEIGERVRQVPARLVRKIPITQQGYGYNARDKDGFMLVMETQDGKLLKWTTVSLQDDIWEAKEGDPLLIDGTVAEHSEYNGDDQTIIKRGKFSLVKD